MRPAQYSYFFNGTAFALSLLGLLCVYAPPAHAESINPAAPVADTDQLLVPAIDVYSGGVGLAERQKIEDIQKDYTLKIIFSGKGGMFLSGVAVTIRDNHGDPLVTHTTDGPVLLAKLPQGIYMIESVYQAHEKKVKGSIKTGVLRTIDIVIPITEEEEIAPQPESVRGFGQ